LAVRFRLGSPTAPKQMALTATFGSPFFCT